MLNLGFTQRNVFFNHFGKSNNCGQDIIKIMSNPSGKNTHCFHLLGMTELFFEVFIVRNIPGDRLMIPTLQDNCSLLQILR